MLPEFQNTSELFFPVVPGSPLSYDQGLSMRQHRGSGMEIYMVKSRPGVYVNAFGRPVPEALAKEAGFDILKNGKEKRRRELMASAMNEIEAQLKQDAEEPLERGAVLRERNGYQVVDRNLGRATLLDPDGNNLLPMPVPHEQALALLDKLVPEVASEE